MSFVSIFVRQLGRVPDDPRLHGRRGSVLAGGLRPRHLTAWFTWLLAAVLSCGTALGQPDGAYPVLASDDGSSLAWLYRDEGLVLAVGEADLSHSNPVLARRAATVDAQRHVIQATALLRGTGGGRLVGTIRHGRVVLVETEARIVRVFYAARLADIEVR